jgi:hypothetical protein
MVDKIEVDTPTDLTDGDISREWAIQLLDLQNDDTVFIVRNLRVSQIGLEAKVVAKIVFGEQQETLKPFDIIYNGKFIAEQVIDD